MLGVGIRARGNDVTHIQDLTFRRGDDPVTRILPRDLEVAVLTARGMERDAIAAELEVSRSAVNRTLRKLFDLTGTKNAAALVALLLAHGVIAPEDVDNDAPAVKVYAAHDMVKRKALKIVRGNLLKSPDGEAEEHVNSVISAIHDELDAKL